jgi:hypothetical protein
VTQDARADLAGLATAEMLLHWAKWVHRRVETIEFVDDERIRRSMSIDFTMLDTPMFGQLAEEFAVVPIPLMFMRKGLLRNFSMVDEEGRSLPLLTREQNTNVGRTALSKLLTLVLGEDRQESAEGYVDDITLLIRLPSSEAQAPFARIRDRVRSEDTSNTVIRDDFIALSTDLATNFVVATPLPYSPGARRIVKVAFEEDIKLSSGEGRGSKSALSLGVPVGSAGSYHIQVHAPAGLEFTDKSKARLMEVVPDRKLLIGYASEEKQGDFDEVVVDFDLARRGLSEAAFIISLVTTLMLFGGLAARLALGIRESSEAASAVIVAVPGIFATYVAGPGEHPLVRQFAFSKQVRILASAAISFLSAITLAITDPKLGFSVPCLDMSIGWRVAAWTVLFGVSAWNTARLWRPKWD